METRTQLNGIRLAPRKVRAVVNVIKKLSVDNAVDQLEHIVRKPAMPLMKLLQSAVANAENNFRMVRSNLYIKDIKVDEGIKLRRFMPRAQGRATEIQKKTSRITIVLDERVAGLKRELAKKKEKVQSVEQPQAATPVHEKPEVKREIGRKGIFGGLRKKIFQRKAI